MDEEGVKRLISSNILGIYDEVPGKFGDYNRSVCFGGKVEPDNSMVLSDKYVEDSDLDYTVIRLAWLNDRDDTNYTVTQNMLVFLFQERVLPTQLKTSLKIQGKYWFC